MYCQDLAGLEPHIVVAAEYDALRDDGLRYANRLLEHGVQCEIYCAARVGHCYNRIPHPYSDLLHDLMAAAFQREFHMEPVTYTHLDVYTRQGWLFKSTVL